MARTRAASRWATAIMQWLPLSVLPLLISVTPAVAQASIAYHPLVTSSSHAAPLEARFNVSPPRAATVLRFAGDPGALILTTSLYAAGRLSHHPLLSDAGRHATAAVLVSGLTSLGIKSLVGRTRPYAAASDADEFHVGRGFRSDYASFPSGHTTVAFAAAAALSRELSRSHSRAGRLLTPLLYSAAAGVGASRLYNNKYWASDVVVAAAIGSFVGRRVVSLAHRDAVR